jgi:Ca2+-binding RTX toxin-like protein
VQTSTTKIRNFGGSIVSRTPKFKDVLYLIDESVSDVASIVREIPASAEVRIIGFDENGVDHILAALAGKPDISAIHLVSHGRPGAIVLGGSVIDTNTLTTRAEDFGAIGRALASDADLLIYGCNVAEGESGRAFLAKLAELTGANVAASETPTGAAHLGGDWNLDVRLGSVQTPLLNIPSYAGVLAAPTIGGLAPIAYTEDGAPQPLGPGVTFTGGLGYAGGSITFGVSGATADDQMSLFSDGDPNAADAISVDGGNVYVGTGTGRVLIGTVDATENGQNGQPLTIHFIGNPTGVFSDSSFESDDPATGWQSEWTVVESRVRLGVDPIAGWPSPADTTHPTGNNGTVSPGDAGPMTDPLDFNVDVVSGGDNASEGNRGLRLHSQDRTSDSGQANSEPYGVIHGPYVFSDEFAAQAGDILRFDWKAEGGDDAFDAFGYLLNADTGETVICLNQSGASTNATTPWTTASVIVPSNGNWQFVFVSGSFDYTGGRKTGGSLYVDNFSVQRSPVNDAVLGALAKHVQYENTSDTPPDAPRTVTVEVEDGSGDNETANTTIDITPVDDGPSGAVNVAGDPIEGSVLTATDNVTDPEGIVSSNYQWQRQLPDGTWVDIGGATGANYTLTQDDVGRPVRAVLHYTDGDGASDQVESTPTTPVANVDDAPSGGVDVVGEPTQGKVLTATNDVVDPDGIDPSSVAYQWQRQLPDGTWVNIVGATGANYTLIQDDVDAGHVRAVLNYTDLGGTSEQIASDSIPVANVNDAPTGAVTITGEAREGQLLTAAVDTLADEDGLGTLTYQWMADGVAIQGATGATFTLTPDQVGKAITVVVSYTDGYGTPERVSSPASSVVVNGNAGNDQLSGGPGNDQLLGGTGDDRLDGYGGRDRLFGEAGNDTLDGGADNDTIDGGSGDDQLLGNSGKDRLYGNEGRDKLSGGADKDTISGGADDDTLDGGSSNDRLYGDSGNDALKGGSGNDWIVGGLGRDKLYGGSGADVFDFNSTQESQVGSQRDTVYDFQSGRDQIDLRGIDANEFRKGNQAFTWSCMDVAFVNPNEADSSLLKTGFTGKAGQLRYDRGILMGDTDGDRKADFQIKIVGHFSSGDLIL